MSEENRRLDPLSDSVFNYMFSDQALKGSMREIINSVLRDAGDTEIGEVQEIATQYDVKRRGFGSHGGRVDVRAKTEDGTLFDIEVQLSTEPAMNARSWFYGSGIMGAEFHEGMPYNQVPKVRIINLLDFTLRKEHPDYLQPIKLMYVKKSAEATDAFRIYNIELPKYRAENPTLESVKNDPLKRWLYMLDKGYENDRELEVLGKMTEGMQAFAEKYRISLTDPDLKRIYDLEMSAKRDQASALYNAKNEGIELGMQKGLAEGEALGLKKGLAEGEALGLKKGLAEGEALGLKKGLAEGEALGLNKGRAEVEAIAVKGMATQGLSSDFIAQCLKMSQEMVEEILAKGK